MIRLKRLMRGQVVVRELDVSASAVLWTPGQGKRQERTHRGIVLGMGPPALTPVTWNGKGGHPVDHGFKVGDVVQYHFNTHQEAWTMPWPPDGLPATWLPQESIDGVWEGLVT